VLWLRSLNPWSPAEDERRLALTHGDIVAAIVDLPQPKLRCRSCTIRRAFGIAGELYSQDFYDRARARAQSARGKLFHYTGTPNRLTSGRDLAARGRRGVCESARALRSNRSGDGLLAVKR
jgi:uncharacterized protein